MTDTLPRPGVGSTVIQPVRPIPGRRQSGRGRSWSARHPGWPLVAMLAGYPVWWALGLADESIFIMALPMVVQMRTWHRRGRAIKVPPAFGLWLLFLVVVAAGLATLSLSAPDTVVSPLSNRILSFLFRVLTYVSLTVILLYAGNLTEDEMPRRKLAWLLGLVGIYTVIGGLGGVVAPSFQFTSPLARVLPASMQSNTLLQQALYPGFSQVTDVLGATSGRPKAPFEYTNIWGDCLTILLPFLIVAWWSYGSRRQRRLTAVIGVLALIPLVYSLNRTAWVAVGLTAVYLAIRMAAQGKVAMMGLVCAGLVLVGLAVTVTPLQGIVTSRLQHQQSNSIRAALSADAILDANASPLVGFGDTQHKRGSAQSIAVGPTADCPSCGQYEVGSNGELYNLLICNGWLGALLFLAFFACIAWRYRRDRTPYGIAGVLVILLSFLYMFAYVAVTAPLEFTMIAVALLWRNDQWRRAERTVAPSAGHLTLVGLPRPVTTTQPWAAVSRRLAASTSWRPAARRGDAAAVLPSLSVPPPSFPPSSVPPPAEPPPGDGQLKEVARGSLLNLAGAGVAGLSLVVMTIVITRTFSTAAAGAFFTAMSLFLIVEAVASLGAATGTTYFIARLRSLGQHDRIPEVIRTATRPVAVVSVVAAVIFWVLADPVARLLTHGQFSQAGAHPADVANGLRALALALPFAAMLDTLLGATRGYRAMGPTVMVDRIGRPVLQLVGIGVAAAAGSAALLAPVWALPYVPAAFIVWLWFRRIQLRAGTAGAGPAVDQPDQPEPLRFWRFTGPRGLATLAQLTIQRIDIVLVAILRGPAEAAIYTAATRFLVAGQFGNQAISMAAQPRFTEMFALGDRQGANRVYQATTAWLVLLTWPFYLLAVSYGPQIITVFGRSYQAGGTVMVILGLTMLLATGCGQVDMVLVTTGRSSWSLLNGLLAVVVNVGLDVVLIPPYGIVGAAIGWSAAIVVTNLLPLAQIALTERLYPFGRGTFITVVLSVLSFAGLPLAARALLGPGVIASLGGIACGCMVMAAGMWRFRHDLNLAAMPGTAQLAALVRRSDRKQVREMGGLARQIYQINDCANSP
jgi:O-antigen/teichoic acid export membrane protein